MREVEQSNNLNKVSSAKIEEGSTRLESKASQPDLGSFAIEDIHLSSIP